MLLEPGLLESANELVLALRQTKRKLALAESCTGGLISAAMTAVAGCSEVFWGSWIVYSNEAKQHCLGVKSESLQKHGAVSRVVVGEMLDGVLLHSGADYAAAVSGIAGPTGGSEAKPVGLVFLGVKSSGGQSLIQECIFSGDRASIQLQAAKQLCNEIKNMLSG
ncbi:MAG: CinA family protein [Spirochaetaceae bacterium]|nr:MAG: CinA family protein [Spirochaetaceae bacterium]